jgi:EAL domain-containing protein (putative c-di-GMP-specific phosphodiesterase class I)
VAAPRTRARTALAEETGLISALGEWVLRRACQDFSRWNASRGPGEMLPVSVNVSPRQFATPGLVDAIAGILRETGLPPTCLNLEITESTIMSDPDAAITALQHLKALGIGLKLDDFGTGYSSFSYLHLFPFDTIKIDRSFITTMESDQDRFEIVRTIIALAKSLNMQIVAEGVETQGQIDSLMSLGCSVAQGFAFSEAVPADAAAKLIEGGIAPADVACGA